MGFLEIQFPDFDSIPMPAKGGPMFNTGIITAASGSEQRNQWWSMPRRNWDVAATVNQEQKDVILQFFMNAAGKANGFRKRDWTDFELVGGVIGTGNGVAVDFQLKKTYTVGGQSVSVNIKKPVTSDVVDHENTAQEDTVRIFFGSGSPLVYTEQTSGWSVDHTTGIVTFDSAPGGGTIITADCEFDIPVRFDTDKLEITIVENRLDGDGGVYTISSLPIVEVRV